MSTVLRDITFARRSLTRRPAFALAAVATMALAIGATSSIYSIVDGVLLRPPELRDPNRLVAVWQTYPEWRSHPILARLWDQIPLSLSKYRDWRAAQTVFDDVAVWTNQSYALGDPSTAGRAAELVPVTRASASLLATVGRSPARGRFFLPGEDVFGGPRVAVVSHEAWVQRFAADTAILGRSVVLDGTAYQIVGVLPRGLQLTRNTPVNPLWIPAGHDSSDLASRSNQSYLAIARLKPGVTVDQATAQTADILRFGESAAKRGARVAPLLLDQTRALRAPLFILLGAVGLLLVIGCVNVAILSLGEAPGRAREVGTRIALGASGGRIVRQLLTESLLIAAAGGALGIAIAWWGTKTLVALAPPRLPAAGVGVDARVVAFSIAVVVAAAVLCGLAPAVSLARRGARFGLGTRASARGRATLQRALVATELALSMILLVAAALLTQSLRSLDRVDPGFRSEGLLTVSASLPRRMASDTATRRAFYDDALRALRPLPGLVAVTAGSSTPFGGGHSSTSYEVEGAPADASAPKREAQRRVVVPGYFVAMGIPLRAGRAFTEADGANAERVVIIGEQLARTEWPNESALGKRVRYQGQWRTIVGVAGDVKFRTLSMDDVATIHLPFAQAPSGMDFLVRVGSSADAGSVTSSIRASLTAVAPAATITRVDAMDDLIHASYAEERYRAVLIAAFAAMGTVLVLIGIYGVTTRAVSGRTKEMGIRVALGASSPSIVRLVIDQTNVGIAAGLVVGAPASYALMMLLAPYLFEITPGDPVTYVVVAAGLTAVSLVATSVPAARAARVSPVTALREE